MEGIHSSFPNSVTIRGTFKQRTTGKILNPAAKQKVLEEKNDMLTSKGCLL